MNLKSVVVEQLEWDATSKSLTLEPDFNSQLWVAFPTDYDEPRNSPFYFQQPKYEKQFNEGFAECQARRISKNNFFEKEDVFTYKTTWRNIPTQRNSVSYYALYLPENAVPIEIHLFDPFSPGKEYKRTVFKDQQRPRFIVYLQCASRFGLFSFDIVCKFQYNPEGFKSSLYEDEFQQDFYGQPEEWKYFLNDNQRNKVEKYFTINMRDQYNVNQAAAVGVNSIANNNVFNQTNYNLPEIMDYDLLGEQIELLKQKLIENATTSEHFKAIAEIAHSQEATKGKDGNNVVKYLLSAGKWVFEIAKDIGVDIVTEIIKKNI